MKPVLILFFLSATCLAQEFPTYSESVAAYRQNVAAGLPISVEWLVTEYELPAAIELSRVENSIVRTALEADVDESTRAILSEKLADGERIVSEESRAIRLQRKVRRHFLWTDGQRFHYRFSDDPSRELDTNFETLSAEGFTDLNMYSLDPDRVPALRAWQGYAADGTTLTGYVGTQDIGGLTNRAFLPPLGFIREEWRRSQQFSTLDRWADQSPDVQQSSEGGVVGGEETILIRTAATNGTNDITAVKRVSAWCAHEKGFVPTKLEWSYSGGEPAVAAGNYPARILETVEVDGITEFSGVFYPKRITSTRYDVSAAWRAAHPSMDGVDAYSDIPYVPVSVQVEEMLAVKVNREIPQRWLDLPFPNGTRFVDVDAQDTYLEGMPKAEFDRQLVKELTAGTGAARHRVSLESRDAPSRWILFAINGGAVVTLAVLFIYTRRRQREVR